MGFNLEMQEVNRKTQLPQRARADSHSSRAVGSNNRELKQFIAIELGRKT
jgi:hypothetical protein